MKNFSFTYFIFKVNGIYTQGENIADNSGLRQAYFAYQKYVQDYGEEKILHSVRQFSPNQLFFISYATVTDLDYRAKSARVDYNELFAFCRPGANRVRDSL